MERRTKRTCTSDRQLFYLLSIALFLMSSVATAAVYIFGGRVNYPYSYFPIAGLDIYSFAVKDKTASIYDWQDVDTGYLYENSDSPAYSWNLNGWLLPADIIIMDNDLEDRESASYQYYSMTNPWQSVLSDDTRLDAGNHRTPEPFAFTLFFVGFLGFLMQFSQKIYRSSRILFDVVVSTIALSIALPVMAAAAFLTKLDSPGPVFYRQSRVGLNRRKRRNAEHNNIPGEKRNTDNLGTLFTIYKLRTMYCNAESGTGAVWAKQNDKRITRIGKFLRKTRLDEVPQFFNVLKGEMSIIGPRPERPEFVQQLNKSICQYYKRHYVKPGITGLAQVRFRYASSISDTRKKLRYDLLYLRKKCPLIDLRILSSTFTIVFLAKDAR